MQLTRHVAIRVAVGEQGRRSALSLGELGVSHAESVALRPGNRIGSNPQAEIRESAHSAASLCRDTRVMSPTVLVAVSSRHGSTDELARKIAATIAEHGLAVDVRPMDEVDTVFPIRSSRARQRGVHGALAKGRSRVRRSASRRHPHPPDVALLKRPDRRFRGSGAFDAEALVRKTGARDHHLFGGRLVKSSLNLRERAFAGLLHVPEGDYREWAAAAAWATAIARTLADQRAA